MKTSTTTHSYCDDDNEILNIDANKNESYLIDGDSCCRKRMKITDLGDDDDDDEDDDCNDDNDTTANDYESDNERRQQQYQLKKIGRGIRESDSLLEAVASV